MASSRSEGTHRERPGEELVLSGKAAQARQDQSRVHATILSGRFARRGHPAPATTWKDRASPVACRDGGYYLHREGSTMPPHGYERPTQAGPAPRAGSGMRQAAAPAPAYDLDDTEANDWLWDDRGPDGRGLDGRAASPGPLAQRRRPPRRARSPPGGSCPRARRHGPAPFRPGQASPVRLRAAAPPGRRVPIRMPGRPRTPTTGRAAGRVRALTTAPSRSRAVPLSARAPIRVPLPAASRAAPPTTEARVQLRAATLEPARRGGGHRRSRGPGRAAARRSPEFAP